MKILSALTAGFVLLNLSSCNEFNVTGDPYGVSEFYIANLSSNKIFAKVKTIVKEDSITLDKLQIAPGDTGYIGIASGMGSPSPYQVINEFEIEVINMNDSIFKVDTIRAPNEDSWDHSQLQASPQKMKWIYNYQQ
jgi:hypothetical protein